MFDMNGIEILVHLEYCFHRKILYPTLVVYALIVMAISVE